MIEAGIIGKLKQLRDKFLGADKETISQIDEWEKRVQQLARQQEYAENDTSKEIVKLLKRRIKGYMLERLKTGLSDLQRAVLDAKETEARYLASLFGSSGDGELSTIEALIDRELEP